LCEGAGYYYDGSVGGGFSGYGLDEGPAVRGYYWAFVLAVLSLWYLQQWEFI